ncbi:zinc-binding alcohol dehydrogenase family protein [Marinobacter adhaerens]|uniref:Zinc-binding alcohol dehydrogenase family protein n=1 Tax=Marinobacter adhaerens TaxID=1033846 RepID=A0A851HX41_9GAMM|nr:zinc-binding alcohol dehydrogenase family protein [Marinobacter adhaerens]NWN92206.1 zinc-binding alcohol dehydrogenase family protein [Marinobacter adhaerens]
MQALQFSEAGSLESLQLNELPKPVPGAGEVLIEVRAAGLNPSDLKNVLGRFPYTRTPRIPGRDFSGVVVEGPDDMLGKAVWGGTGKGFSFTRDGCHAQYVVVPANAVAVMPESLSFAQAATFGVPFITAWDALERSQVQAGTRFLIIGAGAVARAAHLLAEARGAHVVLGVRRAEVVEELQAQGISAFQLPGAEQLPEQTQAHFAQQSPEVIFDTTGFWLPAAVNTVGTLGRIAVIAAPVDGMISMPILNLYRRGGSVIGVNSLLYSLEDCARMLEQINAAFDGALPVPENFSEWSLSDAVAAYHKVNEGGAEKIVLIP